MNIFDGRGNKINIISKQNHILTGKNLIILADSVFDYEQPDGVNIGTIIQSDVDASVHNWAQGGCCMALGKSNEYDAYSFVGIVNALTSGDFSNQELYAEERNFTEQVNDMKTFDMQTCDFMLVAYGTNDYWRNCTIKSEDNEFDPNTFDGAIRSGIKTLLTKYPKIKLIFLNMQQLDSLYIESGGIGTIYPKLYNESINNICGEYSIPVIDIWNDSMINDFTKSTLCDGKPHLKHEGKLRYSKLIENAFNFYF